MKISIKKASNLQSKLANEVNYTNFNTNVQFDEFEDVENKMNSAIKEFDKKMIEYENKLSVVYSIRQKISEANSSYGVDKILNELSMIEKSRDMLERLVNVGEGKSIETIKSMIEKMSKKDSQPTVGFHNHSTFGSLSSSIFNKTDIEQIEARLKLLSKRKMQLQEDLLKINMTEQIGLTLEEEAVLEQAGLL